MGDFEGSEARVWANRGLLLAAIFAALPGAFTGAVVLYDAGQNTSPPPGDQGWQYVGRVNGGGGVLVAPQVVISAAHLGAVANVTSFYYGNQAYLVDSVENAGASDLQILHLATSTNVAGAELFTGTCGDATGSNVSIIGFGGPKGAALLNGTVPYGWAFTGATGTASWGNNTLVGIATDGPLAYASFAFEGHSGSSIYSGGDSGAGMFIFSGGAWKLVGINYAIDGYWDFNQATTTDPNNPPPEAIVAAIYDLTAANAGALPQDQLYTIVTDQSTHQNSYVLASSADPMHGYASFISNDPVYTVGSTGETYAQYMGERISALQVPEPGTLSVAAVSVAALLLRGVGKRELRRGSWRR